MHGLKALSLANAFVPPHELARHTRAGRRRASWAGRFARFAARRPAPAHPAPRVRRPSPTA